MNIFEEKFHKNFYLIIEILPQSVAYEISNDDKKFSWKMVE